MKDKVQRSKGAESSVKGLIAKIKRVEREKGAKVVSTRNLSFKSKADLKKILAVLESLPKH